ncbi:hypothetical protein BH24ACT5_BH24ACT5_27650 [soil metagenome]
MPDTTSTTSAAPEPRGPYPHARIEGGLIWVTGQIGRDPSSGLIVEGGFGSEFDQAIRNLQSILGELGASLRDVVRTEVQFVRESDLDEMNAVYGRWFPAPQPARTSYGAAFLWKGALVQISCVASATPPAEVSP